MTLSDIINASFELFGSVTVMFSCVALLKAKRVAGVSLVTTVFFTSWGIWNLYYYPSLGQTTSSYAAVLVCAANFFWCSLIVKYRDVPESEALASEKQIRDTSPELLDALEELVDLTHDTVDGTYKPDNYTTQPARLAIAKARGKG